MVFGVVTVAASVGFFGATGINRLDRLFEVVVVELLEDLVGLRSEVGLEKVPTTL